MNPDANTPGPKTPRDLLREMRSRMRVLCALRGAAIGSLVGGAVGAAVALLLILAGAQVFENWLWLALVLPVVGAILGVGVGAAWRWDDLLLARAVDRAAESEDRFASAVQLARHHHAKRARLIARDAMAHVSEIRPAAALPLRTPRELKWLAAPLFAIALILWIGPAQPIDAASPDPDITSDEWSQIEDAFRRRLEDLPEAKSDRERELLDKLEELANLLSRKPDQKETLAEIARLREHLRNQQRGLGQQNASLKEVARAMTRSELLRKIATMLRQGKYEEAAEALRELSDKMKEGEVRPDAEEFENMAADLQQMALELASPEDLREAFENAADAASSMNRESLAEALRRLAESLQDNAEELRLTDAQNRAGNLAELLEQLMNQCSGDGDNQGNQFVRRPGSGQGSRSGLGRGQGEGNGSAAMVRRNDDKGGHEAGWGEAGRIDGGALDDNDEKRLPSIVQAQERQGETTTYTVVSPEEEAESGLSYEELYAEFVQKAEADLDLESIPIAHREFLRRYFRAIRPQESSDSESDE